MQLRSIVTELHTYKKEPQHPLREYGMCKNTHFHSKISMNMVTHMQKDTLLVYEQNPQLLTDSGLDFYFSIILLGCNHN